MQDSRSCSLIVRTLCTILPDFAETTTRSSGEQAGTSAVRNVSIEAGAAAGVRLYFTTEVLKSCITSLHDQYFAEVQKDIAALIVGILTRFAPSPQSEESDAARDVLLTLPDVSTKLVDQHLERIRRPAEGHARSRRAEVLALLENVRGVSIHEMGRIAIGNPGAGLEQGGRSGRARSKTAMQGHFMAVDEQVEVVRGGSPEPGSLADLFG